MERRKFRKKPTLYLPQESATLLKQALPVGEEMAIVSNEVINGSLDRGLISEMRLCFAILRDLRTLCHQRVSRKVRPADIFIQCHWMFILKWLPRTKLKFPCSWYVLAHITSYTVLKTKVTISTTCRWTIGDLSSLNKVLFVTVAQCWQRWVPACAGFSRPPLFSTRCHCLPHCTGPLLIIFSQEQNTLLLYIHFSI